ncbi:MAG TPA: hypothetical protein VNO30_15465 [Kofleriaceae bacterium]|nr:hypothetical protein [Kofleriaceae bacterium]
MTLGNVARVAAVLAACAAALGSATSSSNTANQPPPPAAPQAQPLGTAPPPQQMDPGRALGLWRSTFGAVKIEPDEAKGGLGAGAVHGVWVYQRQGQEVVGYFAGQLRGNVLQLRWQEPGTPPLTGEGYLVFDVGGRQYNGRWWSDRRDRVGDWNGWRQQAGAPTPMPAGQGGAPMPGGQGGAPDPYGASDSGATYAPAPTPAPAPAPAAPPAAPRPYY